MTTPGFDFTGGALPSGVSVSRSTVGSRVTSGGLIEIVSANLPRFDYSAGILKGLLLEGSATNLLPYSEQFDSASGWKRDNGSNLSTVSANSGTAPDGTSTAEKFTPNNAQTASFLNTIDANIVSGATYSFSVFLKPAGFNFVRLFGDSISGRLVGNAIFNLSAGTVVSVGTGSAAIQSIGNSWSRCSVTGLSASVGTSPAIQPYVNGTTAATGDGTSGILMADAGLELGAAPSSYFPTTTAAAARGADSLVLNWASLGVPNGACYARITYDDLSTSTIAGTVVSGSQTIAAGSLTRPWVKKVEYLAVPSVPPIRTVSLLDKN